MGYKPQTKVFKFKFDDSEPEYAGLEIRLKSLPMKDFLKIARMEGTTQSEEELDEVMELLAKSIISWNVESPVTNDLGEEEDKPVPVSKDALCELFDLSFILFLITNWMEKMGDVEANLKKASPSTSPSPVASIPMEPLSASHAS